MARQWDTEQTICAVASGEAPATRGVIRVTGPRSLFVAKQALALDWLKISPFDGAPSRPTRYRIASEVASLGLVPVDLWVWPRSQSYTGQPTIEVHTVGSPPILNALVEQFCAAGGRLAEPGEFTLRAFLAGRLDLAQCEAVLGVIHSQSQSSLQVALKQLAGGLELPIRQLRTDLLNLLADIEAGLDFVDEHIEFVSNQEVIRRLSQGIGQVEATQQQLMSRSEHRDSPTAILVGLPNAGKSSLMNRLSGEEVAIVADLAGTTRDFLRSRACRLRLDLVDTAGIEQVVELGPRGAAQQQSQIQRAQANLQLWCLDISQPAAWFEPMEQAQAQLPYADVWLVGTKGDLVDALRQREFLELGYQKGFETCVVAHSRDDSGIVDLEQRLESWLLQRDVESASIIPSTAMRCQTSLQQGLQALKESLNAAQYRIGDEFVASELRQALHELGQVAGEVYTDDLLDAIFSRFCIGK